MNALPPHARQVVLVLPDRGIAAQRHKAEVARMLGLPHMALVEPRFADDQLWLQQLRDQGVLQPGQLLIQDPFAEGEYLRVEHGPAPVVEAVIRRKMAVVSGLCQTLGGRTISVQCRYLEIEGKQFRCEIDAEAKVMKLVDAHGKSRVATDSERRYLFRFERDDDFEFGLPDIPAARALLRATHLEADAELSGLVAARARTNPISSTKITVHVTAEANRCLSLLSDLKVAVNTPKISVSAGRTIDLEWSSARVADQQQEMKVTFWSPTEARS